MCDFCFFFTVEEQRTEFPGLHLFLFSRSEKTGCGIPCAPVVLLGE